MRLASLAFVLAVAACASRSAERGERERPTGSVVRGAQGKTSRPVGRREREKTSLIAGREVVVWAPTTGAAPQPVVVFSHGFHGCATQSRFLTEAIAGSGYWVVAPNHKDALCSERAGSGRSEEPLKNPEQWTDATYADRGEDIRAILRALADSAGIPQRMDLQHLVLVGHSLGGYTVLALAGGWQSWRIPGISAVLALSPYSQPFVVHGTLQNLGAPVMYQGGTRDFGITPFLRRPGGAFDASPAPKYYVEFNGAGHFAWTNLNRGTHTLILQYSLPFVDHYLRGAPDGALKETAPGVSDLRHVP